MNRRSISRAFFRLFNKYIVVPAFQNRLGWIISNSITGHIIVLKTIGKKTGQIRYSPVSYSVEGKTIYCYQGKRLKGQWYLNLIANPRVEVLTTKGRFVGYAQEVNDISEKLLAMKLILKDSGLSGFVYGFNPHTASDDMIQEKIEDIAVVKISLDKSSR
jgi:deazaflavin-dependent oxidoreductase (nitroreductase family)